MKEDWIECELQEVFETVTGNTPSKKVVDNYGQDIPFIKPPDITNSAIKSVSEYLSNAGKKKARVLPQNSVLVTCIGNLGRIGYNKEEVAFNQQINAILPTDFIDFKFTFYQAQSVNFRNQLESLSTSTTVALVNKSSFNSVKIEIAPLPIQRAIVSKIETLFSDLDNGIANFKTAQEQLKIYRQAVLKKAFEGELTKVLFNDWEYSTLKESVKFSQGIQVDVNLQSENKSNNSVRFLRIIDFTQGIDPARYIENPGEKYIVRKDDVSLVRYGASTGFVCSNLEGAIANNLFRIIPVKPIDKKYLYYFLCSPLFQNIISQSVKGAAMPAISFGLINDVVLPFPKNISDQAQIVQEIESRLSVCDKVEQSINESIEKAEALRQSILKKAFEGKLLSQAEIELCKKETDYEPASELLKKIQAEKLATLRQSQDAKKKPTVKKKIKK